MISSASQELGISSVESGGTYYLMLRMEKGNGEDLIRDLLAKFDRCENAESLVSHKELPVFEKYDEYIPAELLQHAFSVDRLDINEAKKRLWDIDGEYFEEN